MLLKNLEPSLFNAFITCETLSLQHITSSGSSCSALHSGPACCRYGQLLSSSLHVSMFMLLAALVLTSFNSTVSPLQQCEGMCVTQAIAVM